MVRLTAPASRHDAPSAVAVARRPQADGRCGVLSTRLRAQTALRICTLHPDATQEYLRITRDALRDALAAGLAAADAPA